MHSRKRRAIKSSRAVALANKTEMGGFDVLIRTGGTSNLRNKINGFREMLIQA